MQTQINSEQALPASSRLDTLFLILILAFTASGFALLILRQIDSYHRDQIFIATQSVLPEHRADAGDQAVLAELARQWPDLQSRLERRPVLEAATWFVSAVQFIGNGRLLVAYEDGHLSGGALLRFQGEFWDIERVFEESEHESAAYDRLLGLYGTPGIKPRTYALSLVRDGEVLSFSRLTLVSENLFQKNAAR